MTPDELPHNPNDRRFRLNGVRASNDLDVSKHMINVLRHGAGGTCFDAQDMVSMHDFMMECMRVGKGNFGCAAVFHMLQCHGKESDQMRWAIYRRK